MRMLAATAVLLLALAAHARAPRGQEKAQIADLKAREAQELDKTSDRREKARIRRRYKLLRKQTREEARARRAEEANPQKMLK